VVSKQFKEQFRKFCTDNNVEWNDKTRKWNKPFHPNIKNIWILSDQGDFLNSLHPKEKGYYESKFLGWKLGVIKKEYCFWCGRIISQKRSTSNSDLVKFCNPSHRKAFGKVKADQEKLGKIFATE